MSRTFHHLRSHLRAKVAKRRKPAELRRLARVIGALALEEADRERAAEIEHKSAKRRGPKSKAGSA
jgi:hypothetical protein